MAIVEMRKVTLLGLIQEKKAILSLLQRMGTVEINEIAEADSAADGLKPASSAGEGSEDALSLVTAALAFLKGYDPQKYGLFSERILVTPEELQSVMDNKAVYLKAAQVCSSLEEALGSIKARTTRLSSQLTQLLPWEGLSVPFSALQGTKNTVLCLGTVPREAQSAFEAAVSAQGPELHLHCAGVGKTEAYYLILAHQTLSEAVSQTLKDFSFTPAQLGVGMVTPAEEIEKIRRALSEAEAEKAGIHEQAMAQLSALRELRILYDGLSIEVARGQNEQKLMESGKAFVLQGWVPAEETDALRSELMQRTAAVHLDFEEPGPREVYPVLLKNPPLVRPFEMVTGLYSTPHHRGLDPNLYMAPFYFAFFGMMVSDAGYGLILALAAAYLTKKLKLRGTGRKLGWLISLGGISTFFWGVLFGGWFGDAGAAAARAMGFSRSALWFDPMDQPLLMLGLCFGLGLVQVFVGMGLQAYMNIKRGKVMDAVFDQGLWYMLIIGLLLLATNAAAAGRALAILGAAGLVLTQGRSQEGVLRKFLSGVLSLYNITGFLSDILSYSRLFALGLATGVIAMVINQLGAMLATHPLMWIFAAVILACGHLFNILINVLGAFVHASRLQYIEFFGKFFEGGGHAFQPLRIQTKYIELNLKEAV